MGARLLYFVAEPLHSLLSGNLTAYATNLALTGARTGPPRSMRPLCLG